MSQRRLRRRIRCRFCGQLLNAWLPVAQEPNGALLLGHLSAQHPTEVKRFLDQMHTTEDIARVAAEAFELVERENDGI